MNNLLTARDLIARMTPTALAEMIVTIEQAGNLDAAEKQTAAAMRQALVANVGERKAEKMIATAH
jgi:hypothetical protein